MLNLNKTKQNTPILWSLLIKNYTLMITSKLKTSRIIQAFFSMLLVLSLNVTAQIQKSHWAMHPNEIDFTGTVSNTAITGSNSASYIAGNSVFDKSGNLLFYVKGTEIYDATSSFAGNLSTYFSAGSYPNNITYNDVEHEIVIVPFEATCNKYYVIYLSTGSVLGGGNNQHQALLYSIVDISSGSVNVTSTNGSGFVPGNGTNPGQLVERFNPGNLGGLAISPILEQGGRFLFCVAGNKVNRYKVTDSGITLEETILTSGDLELNANGFDLVELELFWQDTEETFFGKLGWGQLEGGNAITINLNNSGQNTGSTVYDYLNSSLKIIDIVGFEFHPENYNEFFIMARQNTRPSIQGVYWQKQGVSGLSYLQETSKYWSHIELGRDNKMYIVHQGSGDPAIFDPYAPSTPNTTSLSAFNSNKTMTFQMALEGFYTLPDQIDGVNNVFYPDPESNFTLNGSTLQTSFSAGNQSFNICSPLILNDLSTGAFTYKITLYQLDNNGNIAQTPPSQSFNSFFNSNLKSIAFAAPFQTLSTAPNTGNYKVVVEIQGVCEGSSSTKEGYFKVNLPNFPSAPITINGDSPNDSLPLGTLDTRFNTFSCASSSIVLDNNGWNASGYQVTLQSTDANGNFTSGSSALGTITTGITSNFNVISDLKNLPTAANGNWLTNDAHAGWYKVTLTTYYDCSDINDYSVAYEGYFYLNSAPSPATMLLSMTVQGGSQCSSKVITSNCITGNGATLMNLGISGSTFSSNNITGFKIKIESANCSSGLLGAIIYEDMNFQTPNNPNDPIAGYSLNGLDFGTPGLYFSDKFDLCYKLTVEVQNACSSSSDWTFFQITNDSTQFRLKNPNLMSQVVSTEINIYPNPSNLEFIYFDYNSTVDGYLTYSVIDYTGKRILQKEIILNNLNVNGTEQINLDGLSSGIYFLEIKENGNLTTKKFIKQ